MSAPPRMRRTGPVDLIGPFVVVGVLAYALLRRSYDSLPTLGYLVPVPLLVLAIVEIVAARRVRAVIRHERGAKPMTAIAVARSVALGKASSVVGAGVAGAGLALVIRVAPDAGQVAAAGNDTRVGVFLLAVCVLLVVAGLLLERAGIDPNREDRPQTERSRRD